ncbi:acetyl-CoA carboxylase biotin carboxyl carrier protein [Clostridium oryzae]|uniref:Biotin carboxyl carrier protein of acetyl-CoA carboxylase n=1 Tax=Clostridium oryzae TaxID=1450648 RepID=A0A1V4IU91_9CLOT|nr:acetyl-CoA carboxylase biotin carboxyl carrier protein [Clostridium oryzae]OPJ63611.1 biotin carboxyl carrier protein of acetyl-CoA carboxylase [Clostridium oryzae]
MNLDVVEQLIKMMEKSALSSMEVQWEGMKVKLEKSGVTSSEAFNEVKQEKIEKKVSNVDNKIEEGIAEKKFEEAEDISYIKSPMVGTFYSSPSPDKETFVEVGQRIEKGKVICIIEAMKLMNEIEAEEDGTIIDILVHDGDMVEYGQPMFKIRK